MTDSKNYNALDELISFMNDHNIRISDIENYYSHLQDFTDPFGVLVKYDPNMYEVKYGVISNSIMKQPYLHFKDSFEGRVVIPDGLTYTANMFKGCKLDFVKHD